MRRDRASLFALRLRTSSTSKEHLGGQIVATHGVREARVGISVSVARGHVGQPLHEGSHLVRSLYECDRKRERVLVSVGISKIERSNLVPVCICMAASLLRSDTCSLVTSYLRACMRACIPRVQQVPTLV